MSVDVEDPDLFVSAISILMSWRLIGEFRTIARHRLGADPEVAYELTANPTYLTYTLRSTESGNVETFDGFAHTSVFEGKAETMSPTQINTESLVARLAFPLSLGVWGRTSDDYRFSGTAVAVGENFILDLINTRDSHIRGTLTVNRRLRIAIRLETPTQFLSYDTITHQRRVVALSQ